MHLGYASPCSRRLAVYGPASAAQRGALDRFFKDAQFFIDEACPSVPQVDWSRTFGHCSSGYECAVVVKGLTLTWRQVERARPPAGIACSVRCEQLAAPALRRWLEDPSLSVRPRGEWPEHLRPSQVRCEQDE